MLNPIEINFKLDKTIKRALTTELMIKSHDINVIEFHISFDGLELTADHTVKVLSVFNDTKSQTNVNCDIVDGKAIYRPDTSIISQYEHVLNYVYVYHGDQSLDVREFTYSVSLSKIDETALKVKEVYDQSYAELLANFEQALEDYKDSLPQASDLRAEIDVILTQFGVDSQSAIDYLGEVSTAAENAEAGRVENESERVLSEIERVQAETERKEAEILREDNYEQLIDTAITEADVVEKVDNKITELTPQINNLTAQLAQTFKKNETGVLNLNVFDEPSRNVLQGQEPGTINAVLGEGNVQNKNIANKAVSLDKTNFVKKTKNLFDGNYLDKVIARSQPTELELWLYPRNNFDSILGKTAVIPIEPNETYTIKVHDPEMSNIFRVGINNEYPVFEDTNITPLDELVFAPFSDDGTREYTFTNTATGNYLLVYVSNEGREPRLQVEKGGFATDYIEGLLISNEFVEKPNVSIGDVSGLTTETKGNIFDQTYLRGYILAYRASIEDPDRQVHTFNAGEGGVVAVVPVEPGNTYYVKTFDDSDRLRIATFETEPTVGTPTTRGFEIGNSENEASLELNENENFLAVQVSFSGEEPRMVINNTGFTDHYVNSIVINPKYMPTTFSETKSDRKYIVTGNYSEYVQTEPFIGADVLDTTVNSMKTNDVYRLYDELMENHPTIVSKQLVGYATSADGGEDTNLPIYEYALNAPDNRMKIYPGRGTETGIYPAPTLLYTSGVHGDEKGSIYGLYHFVKQILENEDNKDSFASLISNFTMKIIPVVNPSGVNALTRLTSNGVNINRNFGYQWDEYNSAEKGSAPYSEKETQALAKWFEENSDASAYIDYHNFNRRLSGDFENNSYHFSPIKELDIMYSSSLRRWSHAWRERYMSAYEDLGNVAYGYLQTDYYKATPSTINSAHYEFGIPLTSTPESAATDPTNTDSSFTPDICEIATEVVMNYTFDLIDNFIK